MTPRWLLLQARHLDDTFYVMDLGVVAALAAAWTRLMPRVRPFYAVKCAFGACTFASTDCLL